MSHARSQPRPDALTCPFTVLVDSREQRPFTFSGLGLRSNADEGNRLLVVPTMRTALRHGDYGLLGLPRVAVERKSLDDLFASMTRRKNWVARLSRMQDELDYACIVVEAYWDSVFENPPRFSHFDPLSVYRTVTAWDQRYYRVHWHFWPNRVNAEKDTFRILERYWKDHQSQVVLPNVSDSFAKAQAGIK